MASKPSPKQLVKIGSAKFPTLANLTVPDVNRNNVNITPQRKKYTPQEPNSDLLIELNKLQLQLQKISKNLEGQISVMGERIDFFESNILINKETIENMKGRISRFTYSSLDIDLPINESKMKSEAQKLTAETVIDYLQNKPIILDVFLNKSKDKESESKQKSDQKSNSLNMTTNLFDEFSQYLPDEAKPLFLQYSTQQLNRFSQCFSIFTELIEKTKDISFYDLLTESVKKLFKSNTCLLFIKSKKLGSFSCYFDSKEMQIIVEDKQTVISEVINTGECKTYTDPSSSSFYSPSFDPLFNPLNKAVLLIPISNKAVIYILHTDPLSFCFTNEDCAVGSLLSILLEPLLNDHLNHQKIAIEMQRREELSKFEKEIIKISHFIDLIPFLQDSLQSQISIKKVQLFLIEKNEIFTYAINQKLKQILRRTYDKCGTIQNVAETKRFIIVNKLNNVTVPSYDDKIDSWSEDQPYLAYPILGPTNEVIAVLSISGKNILNKFSEWDNEFIQSIIPVLGIIIQRCIENEMKIEEEQIKKDLAKFPLSISNLKPDLFKQPDFLRLIGMEIEDVLHCEWLSIYINTKFELTLHNHKVFEKPIISVSFSSKFFGKSKNEDEDNSFNFLDVSRVPDFEVGDLEEIENPSCFIFVTHNNVTICALNAKTRLGHFSDAHIEILKAFESVITVAQNVYELQSTILSSKLAIQSLNSVIEFCINSIKEEVPLKSLLKSLCEMSKIENYFIFKRIKLNRSFKPVVSSIEDFDQSEISENDQLFQLAIKKNSTFEVDKENDGSVINKLNNNDDSKVVLISTLERNDTYIFYFGKEKINEESFSILTKLAAVIRAYYDNYILTTKREVVTVSDMNKLEIYNSSIKSEYLLSLSFVSTSLSDSQQVEALLLMVKDLNIIDTLQIELYKLALIFYDIKAKYNNVPYHNFSHAVDVAQFVYLALKKGNLTTFLEPIEIVSLFLGALCHDISHDGVDSATLERCNSAFSFTFGVLSTLERNHAFIASELLKKSEISNIIDNQHFWNFFVNIIVATDITRASEFLTKFNDQFISNGKFDKNNIDHRLLLAQFIIICGNIANCIRPFEFACSMAELLEKEKDIQNEYEIKHDYQGKKESNQKKIQEREVDFVKETASPIFKAFCSFIPNFGNIEKILNENTEKWKKYSPK